MYVEEEITTRGSSVAEQWTVVPIVAGSIPALENFYINYSNTYLYKFKYLFYLENAIQQVVAVSIKLFTLI